MGINKNEECKQFAIILLTAWHCSPLPSFACDRPGEFDIRCGL